MRKLAVVGAGPIGLAAALGGLARGFDVTLLEAAQPGHALRRWGNTRFFTPLSMNVSPRFREVLGERLPPRDALLTGTEFADQVLTPLASSAPLAGVVKAGHRVVAIGRKGFARGDYAGHPLRAERPFRLAVATPQGDYWLEADAVLDASGASSAVTPLGDGGLPAPGERELSVGFIRDLGQLAERKSALAGRSLLLVGHGHSAANALLELERLAVEVPETRVVWAVRSPNLKPCVAVARDPLPERERVVRRANELAARPPAWLRLERRASVERLQNQAGATHVTLTGERRVTVDYVVGLIGYRPDMALVSELAVDISPATEGSLALARALSDVTDCLSVPELGPTDLASGEPGFHFIGAKSYGRARTFLLQTGYAQAEDVLDGLAAPRV